MFTDNIMSIHGGVGRMKHIEVVPYDFSWPKIFETEKEIISTALSDNCVAVHRYRIDCSSGTRR
jgi:GrpB-like predicted nucleotidyltransferase (UPF0157 family)